MTTAHPEHHAHDPPTREQSAASPRTGLHRLRPPTPPAPPHPRHDAQRDRVHGSHGQRRPRDRIREHPTGSLASSGSNLPCPRSRSSASCGSENTSVSLSPQTSPAFESPPRPGPFPSSARGSLRGQPSADPQGAAFRERSAAFPAEHCSWDATVRDADLHGDRLLGDRMLLTHCGCDDRSALFAASGHRASGSGVFPFS